jgi:hypothetical protein
MVKDYWIYPAMGLKGRELLRISGVGRDRMKIHSSTRDCNSWENQCGYDDSRYGISCTSRRCQAVFYDYV